MKKIAFLVVLLLSVTCGYSQRSTYPQDTRDSIRNKVTRNKFWGNSTYVSAAINFARNKEYEFNLGRTYGRAYHAGRGMGEIRMHTWGAGYGYSNALGGTHTVNAFYEYSRLPFILFGTHVLRGEYIYNITDQQHYLRPSVGIDLFYIGISYHYSFLLNEKSGPNIYRHGLNIRGKYYLGRRKHWERHFSRHYFQY
jgi:hypothetical protein